MQNRFVFLFLKKISLENKFKDMQYASNSKNIEHKMGYFIGMVIPFWKYSWVEMALI